MDDQGRTNEVRLLRRRLLALSIYLIPYINTPTNTLQIEEVEEEAGGAVVSAIRLQSEIVAPLIRTAAKIAGPVIKTQAHFASPGAFVGEIAIMHVTIHAVVL